jgi:glyoxylase-like metal-dependent hydrolase (beta-lactamase superfamily II)
MTVSLTLLAAGSCRDPERLVHRGGSWKPVDLPSLVGVIRHPTNGVLLYDTGYAPRFFTETARPPASLYARMTPVTCTEDDTAAAQLRQAGVDPGDVTHILISHFHADHVGGLRDFPRARFVYIRTALDPSWRKQTQVRQLRHGFLAGLLPPDFDDRSDFADDRPPAEPPLPGLGPAFDLFGDGTLLAIDLPGHTPGQLGLLVRLQGHRVLLVGDACWNGRAITHGELPHPVVRAITHDWRQYRRTIAALSEASAQDSDLVIVPSHCAASIARATQLLITP